jgi:hypothetical protein
MHSLVFKLKNILTKYSLIISLSVFIISFLFSRLPFFIWAPIPGFAADTYIYFLEIHKLENGILPTFDWLPQGFPFVAYLIGLISHKILAIIYGQNIIRFLCSVFLIKVIDRHYSWVSILSSLSLSIHIMDSTTILFDTSLTTESLYSSILILICALLISALNSGNKYSWILFSSVLILPALFRSNGLYIYFIPLWIILFILVNNYPKKYYLYIILPFIIANLAWSSYNYLADKKFNIGYIHRINNSFLPNLKNLKIKTGVLNQALQKNNQTKPEKQSFIYQRSNFFKEYLTNLATDTGKFKKPFYYATTQYRYRFLYVEKWLNDTSYAKFPSDTLGSNYRIPVSLSFKKFIYREYFDIENDPYRNIISQFDWGNKTNLWLKLYQFYYVICVKIFWNMFWVAGFIIVLCYSLFLTLRSKFKNKNSFIILTICLIHFLALIIVSVGNNRVLTRYISVSEFIDYLVLFLIPVLFKKDRNLKNS